MIFNDFLRAVGQIGDAPFRRVLLLGLGLSLALLIAVYLGFLTLVQIFVPDSVTLPWIGTLSGVDTVIGWGSAVLMIGLSVFLMMPVAALFTSFFLEQVVDAVEERHYPTLPDAIPMKWGEMIVDSLGFFGLLIVANLVALILYFFAGPFIPLVFWAVNGFLLGREYFTLVATRRLGREGARALRRKHGAEIWFAGTLMAVPLSIPLVNLLVPVLGAATFTHMFQRLNKSP